MVLDDALTAQLREHFTKITRPVELVAWLDDTPRSAQVESLLTELAALSDHIAVVRQDGDAGPTSLDERRPSFAVRRVGTDVEVRFAGLPL
ncbi:MAG: alkyl hydroperoxide reductase subunit F, partial [Acidimicrobiales bacterium]|nr:alkyl hydroperoxide reductase subunit F [Acidimicrobiales bacterium]